MILASNKTTLRRHGCAGKPGIFLLGAICVGFCASVCLAAETQASTVGSEAVVNSSPEQNNPTSTDDVIMQDEERVIPVAPVRTLSLQTCFDLAARSNKEIIAALYSLPALRAGIKIAGAIPNPRFTLLYGFGPAFTVIIAGNPQQFGWQQDIQTAGKRSKQIDLARANYSVGELQALQLMFDVHNRTRRAYAEQAAAEAYADLIEAERKVALDLGRVAEYRYKAGKAPRSEVLQAQLGVMQFDTQRNQAQQRLQQATVALSQLIGEVPEKVEIIDVDDNGIFKLSAEKTALVPQPERALPDLEQLLPAAYDQRSDLKVAIQQAYSDRKALTLARAQRIPDVFVDTGYQFTTFERLQPYGLVGNNAQGKEFTTPNSPGCYLNITAEMPIFYQHQGETRQAKATWLQDYDQINQLKWQIASDVVTAYESVAVARANIFKFQKELIPQAAEVARLARRSYQVGKTDLASAILARQQYQQILSSYFDAVVAYQNAWADFEKAIGVPLQL